MAKKLILPCPKCKTMVTLEKGFMGIRWKKSQCPNPECNCEVTIDDRTQLVECPHCHEAVSYDVTKGAAEKCPHCGANMKETLSKKKLVPVECPHCHVVNLVEDDGEQYQCMVCDGIFNSSKAVAKKQASDGENAYVIQCEQPDYGVWKHPLNYFPYRSQLVVSEGVWGVCLQNGECRYPVKGGIFPLNESVLTKEERFDAAVQGKTEGFSTEIYFVSTRIPHEFKWGLANPPMISDGRTEVSAFANGVVQVVVVDPKAFLDFIGYRDQKFDDMLTQCDMDVAGSRDSLLINRMRDLSCRTFSAAVKQLVAENEWDPMDLEFKTYDVEVRQRELLDEELAGYGLRVDDLKVNKIMPKATERSVKERERAEAEQASRDRIRLQVEKWFDFETLPANIHMKDNISMSATLTLCGRCSLYVRDLDQLLSRAQVQQWMKTKATDTEVEKFLLTEVKSQLNNAQSDLLQKLINATNADVRELAPFFGEIREQMCGYLNAALSKWGLGVESFALQQKSLVKSKALEMFGDLNEYKFTSTIARELESLQRENDLASATAEAEQRMKMRNLKSQEKQFMGRMDVADAQDDARNLDAMTDVQISTLNSEERLRQHKEALQEAAIDHQDARKHQKTMQGMAYANDIAVAKESYISQSSQRAFEEAMTKQQRDQLLDENKIMAGLKLNHQVEDFQLKSKVQLDTFVQTSAIEYDKRAQQATHEAARSEAEQKRIMGSIFRKIEESDFDWQQKMDAYRRLLANTALEDAAIESVTVAKAAADVKKIQATSDAEETKIRTDADAYYKRTWAQTDADAAIVTANADLDINKKRTDLGYTAGHLKNLLTKEENDLIEEMQMRSEQRSERRAQAQFVRQMQAQREAVAHEMELLNVQVKMQQAQDAMAERIYNQQAEIEKLQIMLAHYEEMADKSAEVATAQLAAATTQAVAGHAVDEAAKADAMDHELAKMRLTFAHEQVMGKQGVQTTEILSTAETVRALAEQEYARLHAEKAAKDAQRLETEKQLRDDKFTLQAKGLLEKMMDLDAAIKSKQLDVEHDYHAGRAEVDKAAVQAPGQNKVDDLIKSTEKLLEEIKKPANDPIQTLIAAKLLGSDSALADLFGGDSAKTRIVVKGRKDKEPDPAAQPGVDSQCPLCKKPLAKWASFCTYCNRIVR